MSESGAHERGYEAQPDSVRDRTVWTHKTSDSFASATSSDMQHPLFVTRSGFGSPWKYAFLDNDGAVHRAPGVYSPTQYGPIETAKRQHKLVTMKGTVRIEAESGDVLMVHQPEDDCRPTKATADAFVAAWQSHVRLGHDTGASAVLLYQRLRGVTIADYKRDDVHVITAFPEWAGHSIQSVTADFPADIPQIETECAPWQHQEAEAAYGGAVALGQGVVLLELPSHTA